MLVKRGRSWRQGSRPQAVNQAQDDGDQASRDRDLSKLERESGTVADDFGTDLDQLFPQRGQRLVLDFLRQSQCPSWVQAV